MDWFVKACSWIAILPDGQKLAAENLLCLACSPTCARVRSQTEIQPLFFLHGLASFRGLSTPTRAIGGGLTQAVMNLNAD
jgi:hypothetical protein